MTERAAKLGPLVCPILLSLYSPLALAANNVGQIPLLETVRSLLGSAAFGLAALLLLWLVFRDWQGAAILASILVILFFSYGHVYDLLKVSANSFARHRILAPVWGLGYLGIGRLIHRVPTSKRLLSMVLLPSAVVAALIPGIELVEYQFNRPSFQTIPAEQSASATPAPGADSSRARPDIFYIVLDAYGGADILSDYYQIDNSDFVDFLLRNGFFVASEGTSNYTQTSTSLASSLNMRYLNDLAEQMGPAARDLRPLADLIWNSQVRGILEERGYEFVAFESGLPYTSIEDASTYLRPDFEELNQTETTLAGLSLNSFEGLLLRSSMARIPFDFLVASRNEIRGALTEFPYQKHRTRVLFTLSSLSDFAEREGDFFIFAHVISPHPPFVFGPSGEEVPNSAPFSFQDNGCCPTDEYLTKYRDQLIFVTRLVRLEIEEILLRSETPPIIILQGDHGPGAYLGRTIDESNLRERFSILNAYHFPEPDRAELYPAISPVNTFRIVLGSYFDLELPVLLDRSYFSPGGYPYDLTDVTDEVHLTK